MPLSDSSRGLSDFNSRPSARGDASSGVHHVIPALISIHAPPRGATETGYEKSKQSTFQFTPLREGRRSGRFPDLPTCLFQFTPLREGRHSGQAAAYFRDISIHAPPRGATGQIYAAISAAMAISIHAPPRGATVSSVPHYFFPVDFNSRPSARGDHRRHKYMQGAQKFQFTPLREGRLKLKLLMIPMTYFNSRPSAMGDLCIKQT